LEFQVDGKDRSIEPSGAVEFPERKIILKHLVGEHSVMESPERNITLKHLIGEAF